MTFLRAPLFLVFISFLLSAMPAQANLNDPVAIDVNRVERDGQVKAVSADLIWHWSPQSDTPCAQIDFNDHQLSELSLSAVEGSVQIPFTIHDEHVTGCMAGYYVVLTLVDSQSRKVKYHYVIDLPNDLSYPPRPEAAPALVAIPPPPAVLKTKPIFPKRTSLPLFGYSLMGGFSSVSHKNVYTLTGYSEEFKSIQLHLFADVIFNRPLFWKTQAEAEFRMDALGSVSNDANVMLFLNKGIFTVGQTDFFLGIGELGSITFGNYGYGISNSLSPVIKAKGVLRNKGLLEVEYSRISQASTGSTGSWLVVRGLVRLKIGHNAFKVGPDLTFLSATEKPNGLLVDYTKRSYGLVFGYEFDPSP